MFVPLIPRLRPPYAGPLAGQGYLRQWHAGEHAPHPFPTSVKERTALRFRMMEQLHTYVLQHAPHYFDHPRHSAGVLFPLIHRYMRLHAIEDNEHNWEALRKAYFRWRKATHRT